MKIGLYFFATYTVFIHLLIYGELMSFTTIWHVTFDAVLDVLEKMNGLSNTV